MSNAIQFLEKSCAYRLENSSWINALVSVRSAGYYRLGDFWQQQEKRGNFLELFWGMDGVLEFPGKRRLHKNEALFIMPGELHRQQIICFPAAYCWLTLDGHIEEMIQMYNIDGNIFDAGACPEHFFRQLINEVRHITPAMGYAASATALKIVHQALGYAPSNKEGELLVNEFCKMVEKFYSSGECNIDYISSMLGISRVTLFRAVTGRMNCTPKEYLDKYRLREAVDLLINTAMSVNDIALSCGYSGANYFCKVFRKQMGTSPEMFRRNSH